MLQYQYLTSVVLNFEEASQLWAPDNSVVEENMSIEIKKNNKHFFILCLIEANKNALIRLCRCACGPTQMFCKFNHDNDELKSTLLVIPLLLHFYELSLFRWNSSKIIHVIAVIKANIAH